MPRKLLHKLLHTRKKNPLGNRFRGVIFGLQVVENLQLKA